MTLRTRLLIAFTLLVLVPIALLALGLRHTMTERLSEEYRQRLERVRDVVGEDLAYEGTAIRERLTSLAVALRNDNQFRRGAVAGDPGAREYVLEYAGTAMRLTGLSMLQIHDAEGRIISSGHFRNEHGRVESGLPSALAGASGAVLVTARDPQGGFVALARAEPLHIAGRPFTIVGGTVVDDAFLRRLARDRDIVVSLRHPGGVLSSAEHPAAQPPDPTDAAVTEPLRIPLLQSRPDAPLQRDQAALLVSQPLTPIRTLVREADTWFLATAAGTSVTALVLAVWVSSRISRPLADLAEKTAVLDLDRLDVQFDGGTDEVGRLSHLLGDLAERLRTSTARIREAERRATVGDLARQINHDIKNGLIPLRNVMRHLTQVAHDDPGSLAPILDERRQTIDSSIGYLETLATHYGRLSPAPIRRECDINALVAEVVRGAQAHEHAEVRAELAPQVPRVLGDPIALRRILENLVANAVESLEGRRGRITISTTVVAAADDAAAVRLVIADTGRGMTRDESSRIFNDFYTTKQGGTGLGLSIVRRLVVDAHGALRVESEPGAGTRMIVEIPAAGRASTRDSAGVAAAPARSRSRRSL